MNNITLTEKQARARMPLNGRHTHPLTAHAAAVLDELAIAPKPKQEINAGVCNRLARGEFIQTRKMPSPYKTHKGSNIDFVEITDAGRAWLESHKEPT